VRSFTGNFNHMEFHMQTLNHKQVVSLIKAIGHTRTVLVQGEAGCGKTSIHYELERDRDLAGLHFVKPIDCTQLSEGSIWMPDLDRSRGVSRELPNERLGVSMDNQEGVEGSRPVALCFDEIAKSRQYIKDAIAPIIYERRVGDYRLPKGSLVFACTNLSEEGLGDSLAAHLRDRLVKVMMRKPTKDEWVNDFAVPNGLNAAVIGAVEELPRVFDSFTDYTGKKLAAENPYIFNPRDVQEGWVTPRGLHAASDLVDVQAHVDEQTLEYALCGTVGAPFASHLMSYIRFGNDLPAYSRILDNPTGCPLPTNPTAQVVLVFKLLTQTTNREEAEAVTQYVLRLRAEMQTLFSTTVSKNSEKVKHFVTVKEFGAKLLRDNSKFFGA
jgi:hypothetical protein